MQDQRATKNQTKESSFVKFFRVIVWGLVAVVLPISISLKSSAESSASYADGSYALKSFKGNWLFWIILVVGILNLGWGITRWVLRWRREKWTAGKVVGKLIGGGIWRFFAITPIILSSFLFLSPAILRFVEKSNNDIINIGSSFDKISADYNSGKINVDEYVEYLTDSIYNTSNLPKEYISSSGTTPYFDLAQIVADNIDSLNVESVKYFYEKFSLSKISKSVEKNNIGFIKNVYADEAKSGNVLDLLTSAKMSRNKHFVIFYSTIGPDAISDADAKNIGDILENAVDKYHDIFYQNWYYQKVIYGGEANDDKRTRVQWVLSSNGIDENALDKSLPVYIFNYDGSDLAHCTATTANNITKILSKIISMDDEVSAENYNATFPYIAVKADSINDMKKEEVLVHELSHHYANSYCQKNTLSGRVCSKVDDVFSEATAQYSALTIVNKNSNQSFINQHHQNYIDYATCRPADEIIAWRSQQKCGSHDGSILGYSATAFLQNYGENVPDFQKDMFKLLAQTENRDLLELLYEKSGEDSFKKTMVNLAQRNLTNEYESIKSLHANKIPPGQKLPCLDFCEGSYSIDEASSQYFYISTSDDISYAAVDYNPSYINVGILGKRDNVWKVLQSNDVKGMIKIDEYSEYDVLAIVVTNYGLTSSVFRMNIYSEELVNTIESAGDLAEGVNESFSPIGKNCYLINTDSFFDIPVKLYGLISDGIKLIDLHDSEDDFSPLVEAVDNDANQISQELSDAREELSNYNIIVCKNNIADGVSFDEAKSRIRKSLDFNLNVYDEKNDDDRTSVFAGFDLVKRSGHVYTLLQIDGEISLMTVNVSEK